MIRISLKHDISEIETYLGNIENCLDALEEQADDEECLYQVKSARKNLDQICSKIR